MTEKEYNEAIEMIYLLERGFDSGFWSEKDEILYHTLIDQVMDYEYHLYKSGE